MARCNGTVPQRWPAPERDCRKPGTYEVGGESWCWVHAINAGRSAPVQQASHSFIAIGDVWDVDTRARRVALRFPGISITKVNLVAPPRLTDLTKMPSYGYRLHFGRINVEVHCDDQTTTSDLDAFMVRVNGPYG